MRWTTPVYLGLSICFVALSFAAFFERSIFREGSELFFAMERWGRWGQHCMNCFRHADMLLSLPSYLLIRLSGGVGGDWLWLSHVVAGLTFYLHPFVFLYLSHRLIEDEAQKKLWSYSVLGFALGIIPVLPYGVSSIPLGVSAFLTALHLILRSSITPLLQFLYVILITIMSFEHESTIFLSLFLVFAVLTLKPKNMKWFLIPPVLSFLWYIVVLGFLHTDSSFFLSNLRDLVKYSHLRFYYLVGTVGLVVVHAISNYWKRLNFLSSRILTTIALFTVFYVAHPLFLENIRVSPLQFSFFYRTISTLMVALVAFAILIQKKAAVQQPANFKWGLSVLLILLAVSIDDLKTTHEWRISVESIRNQIKNMDESCVAFGQKELQSRFSFDLFIAPTSIVLQHSSRPAKIIGHLDSIGPNGKGNFCADLKKGFYTLPFGKFSDSALSKLSDTQFMKFDLLRQ